MEEPVEVMVLRTGFMAEATAWVTQDAGSMGQMGSLLGSVK